MSSLSDSNTALHLSETWLSVGLANILEQNSLFRCGGNFTARFNLVHRFIGRDRHRHLAAGSAIATALGGNARDNTDYISID